MKKGNLIRITRGILGETQEEFGKRFYYESSMITRMEKGERTMTPKIINFCVKTINEFIEEWKGGEENE